MVGVLGITSKKSLPVFRLQKYYPIFFPRRFVLGTFVSMSGVHLELFGGISQGALKPMFFLMAVWRLWVPLLKGRCCV